MVQLRIAARKEVEEFLGPRQILALTKGERGGDKSSGRLAVGANRGCSSHTCFFLLPGLRPSKWCSSARCTSSSREAL